MASFDSFGAGSNNMDWQYMLCKYFPGSKIYI